MPATCSRCAVPFAHTDVIIKCEKCYAEYHEGVSQGTSR